MVQPNGDRTAEADAAPRIDGKSYLESRVEGQLKYYETAANRAKNTYLRTQTAIIVIGVLVPVTVNLPKEILTYDIGPGVQVAATVLSLTLAILAGLTSFRKWGDLWLSFRMTEEILKQEKYLFLTRAGTYHDQEDPVPIFVERIESIVSTEHQKFRSFIEEARRPQKGNGG